LHGIRPRHNADEAYEADILRYVKRIYVYYHTVPFDSSPVKKLVATTTLSLEFTDEMMILES
jgi:hypothetical protein